MLDLKAMNFATSGFSGIISVVFIGIFFIIMGLFLYNFIKYFIKNQYPDKWKKGILELYDPLKQKKN